MRATGLAVILAVGAAGAYADPPECTARQVAEWKLVHEGQLGMAGRNRDGHYIGAYAGRTKASWGPPGDFGGRNWFPADVYRKTMCGPLKKFTLYATPVTGAARDFHPYYARISSPFRYLFEDMAPAAREAKEIYGEITLPKTLEKNPPWFVVPGGPSLLFGSRTVPAAAADTGPRSLADAAVKACVCTTGCRGMPSPVPEHDPARGARVARGAGVALGLTAGLSIGRAAGPGAASKTLRGWRTADAVVGGGALALFLAQRLFDEPPEDLARERWSDCREGEGGASHRECALNPVDAAVRSTLVAETPEGRVRAARISDATVFASIAFPLAVAQGAGPYHRERDVLVAAETYAVMVLVSETAKRFFDRPRPFVHHCDPLRRGDVCEADGHYSFFSGHSSTSFAMVVAAGTMSHLHGYRHEGWIWATGLTLATTTGVMRIVADKHYLTDVAVGAAVGGLGGWLIPRLHRPEGDPGPRARPAPGEGAALLSLPFLGSGRKAGLVRAGFADGPFAEVSWRW